MLAQGLMVASAAIMFTLGALHLLYTFHGSRLLPRDPTVQAAMDAAHLRLTRQTTVWRAWIGFNASHSMGPILYALVYAYLALAHPAILFSSAFLLGVGLVLLGGYLVLARLYWFRIPLAGISLALACYAASIVAARA